MRESLAYFHYSRDPIELQRIMAKFQNVELAIYLSGNEEKNLQFRVSRLLSKLLFVEGCGCDHREDCFWLWLGPRRRRQTRGGPQTSAMSFLRTASHHAMTTLRVWTELERIDKDFNFRVVGEGKFFLYSGLFEQI